MPDAQETNDHAQAAQEPGPPCQCEQQLGNALPLLLVALAVVMALDRWSSWRKKKKQEQEQPDGGGSDRPRQNASREDHNGCAR
jgi:hypothetical protein